MRVYIITQQKDSHHLDIDCNNTDEFLQLVAQTLGVSTHDIIVTLRALPNKLRIIPGWSLSYYTLQDGAICDVFFLFPHLPCRTTLSTRPSYNGSLLRSQPLIESESLLTNNLSTLSKIVKGMQERNEDVQMCLNRVGQCGINAIHLAIHSNNLDIVSYLILKRANPNVLTADDYTPLQLAVLHRAYSVLQTLIRSADVNQLTSKGTALHLAYANGDKKCIDMLIEGGAKTDIADFEGNIIGDKVTMKCNKVFIPHIGKGMIGKISTIIRRKKECQCIVNAFKNQLAVDGEIYKLSNIVSVRELKEKKFLMKNEFLYLQIEMKNDSVTIALQHRQILDRWIELIKQSIRFVNANVNVSKEQHLVQVLDDKNNKIQLHKRKIEPKKAINNDKSQTVELFLNNQFKSSIRNNQLRNSFRNSQFRNSFRNSQLLIGSIIDTQEFSSQNTQQKQISFYSQRNSIDVNQLIQTFKKEDNKIQQQKKVLNFYKKQKQTLQIQEQISLKDFIVGQQIGNGAFGKVYLVKHRESHKIYALKTMNKNKMQLNKSLNQTLNECSLYKKLNHKVIKKLYFSFQTAKYLFLIFEYCAFDLSKCMKQNECSARVLTGQIILGLEYLHKNSVYCRKVKAEKILIGADGLPRLGHFASSKEPQMKDEASADVHGLGCVLYEMLIGQPPNLNAVVKYPADLSKEARGVIAAMLQKDPTKRISLSQVKAHDFYKSSLWQQIVDTNILPKANPVQFVEGKMFNQLDYQDRGEMLNRVKNFTYVRHQ